jgi:hypothetical protein
MKSGSVCLVSNIGWILISLIGVMGSLSHPIKDVLFLSRYSLALIANILSVISIRYIHRPVLGKLSVLLFLPFLFIQLFEIWVVCKCESGLSTYRGIDCDSLLIFPDESKILQIVTDEVSVFLLSAANLILLWQCHISKGYLIYGNRPFGKESRKPLLSDNDEFISAEEGESYINVRKVYDLC